MPLFRLAACTLWGSLFFVPLSQEGCVCCPSLDASLVGTPGPSFARPCLPAAAHVATRPAPGAARVVCLAGCVRPHSGSPRLPVWGRSPWALTGLRSAAFSVYRPPGPCSACFSETSQPLFGPASREFPCAKELLFQGSFGAQAPAQTFSIFPLLCLPPLSYLIAGSLACPPGGLGSSAVASRLLCRSYPISWWVFDVFVGRLVIYPPYSTIFCPSKISVLINHFRIIFMCYELFIYMSGSVSFGL